VPDPNVRFKGTYREEGWRRCEAMSAGDARFTPWPHERLPGWSLPALEAAKCLAKQDPVLHERFHLDLYRAFFTESLDIADPAVVEELVAAAGADLARFRADRDAGLSRQAVIADYEAAAADGVSAIPTVIVVETGRRLVGLADLAGYRAAIQEALS
jgi:predicted DsbA family dithiol-disulfide isomerase